MADINDPNEYDPPADISTDLDRAEDAIASEVKSCRHGKDPRDCEDVECLIKWHEENDADDMDFR
jgi:hypothetical protein